MFDEKSNVVKSQNHSARGKSTKVKYIALILAGYNKTDLRALKMHKKELIEAYDGDEIYIGKNKFLQPLNGKPIIQYVLDAVYNAKINGKRIYDEIYLYNDVKLFNEAIDSSKYDNLNVRQMKDSVAGHWKDFYKNYVDYGDRVDVFFGDTPRITTGDVEYVHGEFNKILGIEKDHRGKPVRMIFSIAEYNDMKEDNWLEHRIKYYKMGQHKGRLKSFVGLNEGYARVGNSGGIIKHESIDPLFENEMLYVIYNMRKALMPSTFSKILFYLWKTKHFDFIKKVKNRQVDEIELIETTRDVFSKLYKVNLDDLGFIVYRIKNNTARWENDVDGPKDYNAFKERMER